LRIIIEVLSGIGPIAFIVALLFLVFYLLANICVAIFGTNDPMHFGNLHLAFVSLFVVTTLDDWTDAM
jgi:voltage-gated sodium channel